MQCGLGNKHWKHKMILTDFRMACSKMSSLLVSKAIPIAWKKSFIRIRKTEKDLFLVQEKLELYLYIFWISIIYFIYVIVLKPVWTSCLQNISETFYRQQRSISRQLGHLHLGFLLSSLVTVCTYQYIWLKRQSYESKKKVHIPKRNHCN